MANYPGDDTPPAGGADDQDTPPGIINDLPERAERSEDERPQGHSDNAAAATPPGASINDRFAEEAAASSPASLVPPVPLIINDPLKAGDVTAGDPAAREEASPPDESPGREATFQVPSAALNDRVHEEVDLWWGGYSSWAMLPSWALTVAATAVIVWLSWMLLPRDIFRLVITALVGAVWLLQLTRWSMRFFGFSVRLTTRRLYVDRGWLYSQAQRIDLERIQEVRVVQPWWARLAKVGRIEVIADGGTAPALVIDGVRDPERAAKQLRHAVELAKERATSPK